MSRIELLGYCTICERKTEWRYRSPNLFCTTCEQNKIMTGGPVSTIMSNLCQQCKKMTDWAIDDFFMTCLICKKQLQLDHVAFDF